jgi:SAM-dependent methyltransferase
MDIIELFRQGMDRPIIPPVVCHKGYSINVGAGSKGIPGARPLDYPEWDGDKDPLPYMDGVVGTIYAYHFLEHLQDPVKMLLEFQRVLRPGGVVNIVVPYYSAQIAAHDLDHKHVFTEETWRILFGNPYYNKNRIEWKLTIGTNIIIGIVERNLCLMTQLIRAE